VARGLLNRRQSPPTVMRPSLCPRLFLAAALAAGLAVAAPAQAQRTHTAALGMVAAQRGQLKSTLKRSHDEVNQALKARSLRLRSFQSILKRRERAAARLERLKAEGRTDLVLDRAMREALVLDEEAQRARAALLAAEAEVARRGAGLLELFDLVLAQQNRKIRAMAAEDTRRRGALAQYGRLAQQRAQVRQLLQPVLAEDAGGGEASLDEVRAAPTDDVETLLEKADLARDLEERFRRRAAEVRRRIKLLEQQRSLARATVGMVRESNLFGEDDYRPVFSGGQAGAGPQAVGATNSRGGGGALLAMGGAPSADAEAAPNTPPPSADQNVVLPGGDGDGDAEVPDAPAPAEEPAPPPAANDPDVGFNSDAEVDGARDDDGLDTAGGQAPITGGAGNGPTTDPSARFSGLPTEQVYLGAGAESDARLRELIASDNLSLADLKRLERKLLGEAGKMKRENQRINKRLRGELKR
jgi:hypothetical protein